MRKDLEERGEALLNKSRMVVDIDPAIASIFENSKKVSCKSLCYDPRSSEKKKKKRLISCYESFAVGMQIRQKIKIKRSFIQQLNLFLILKMKLKI